MFQLKMSEIFLLLYVVVKKVEIGPFISWLNMTTIALSKAISDEGVSTLSDVVLVL